jgi:ribonuclease BN (tRNA processing enzyme)
MLGALEGGTSAPAALPEFDSGSWSEARPPSPPPARLIESTPNSIRPKAIASGFADAERDLSALGLLSAPTREGKRDLMTTELVLLGTAGAPMPVAGRAGIASALVVDGRVFVVDCGRGAPSAFTEAGLDFTRLEAVFLSHLHVDHTGDLAGMLLYPWGVRVDEEGGPLPPVRVYGPGAPLVAPAGDATFHRDTTIHPERPFPGVTDLVDNILAGYAYHLNVMPLDSHMPDAGCLVRATDIHVSAPADGTPRDPIAVFDDGVVRVTTVPVSHGHAHPALAYRFDTSDGAVVFSGDTTVNDDLIALARGAEILVHQVTDLDYLERHGLTGLALERMAGLQTDVNEVGRVAERAGVGELILSHYLPGEPEAISEAEWAERAAKGFSGRTIAGRDGLRRTVAPMER